MIRSNQAGQAKNRPPRREEGENGNLQRFPLAKVRNLLAKPTVRSIILAKAHLIWIIAVATNQNSCANVLGCES
ncbi:hypothetical protein [Profundibacter sp.]|uniref:hypothetical protein n=1 Tax=Profundibacter sp. TaxID=3101071 RepID=UPI003D0D873F